MNADEVIRRVSAIATTACRGCGAPLCGHDAVVSVAMGFADAARCVHCLAGALDAELAPFRDKVYEHVRRRDCYLAGWRWASGQEGVAPDARPRCPWGATTAVEPELEESDVIEAREPTASADHEWDAGDIGCGELVLELRLKLRGIAAGQVLAVTATDLGAAEDLPAWCKLTGHALERAEHPRYWIRRRSD